MASARLHDTLDPSRDLYRLMQHYSIIEAMLLQHKAPPPVVRAWAASFATARRHATQLLSFPAAPAGSADASLAVDVMLLVKPFAEVLQRYMDAGAALITQTVECMLDFELLFAPGASPVAFTSRSPHPDMH